MVEKQKYRLLVPMNIEALVVGDTSNVSGWADLKPDFRSIRFDTLLGQDLEKEPFSPTSKLYDPGIHLHWALPDGLAHGAKDANEELKFPQIPNRWLVVRLWDKEKKSTELDLQFKAWIVESDTITDDETSTSYPRLQAKTPGQPAVYECVFAGKQFELSQWPGEQPSSDSLSLTALGYGDPSFAAYYPACKNALGFWDKDVDDLKDVTLSYFVTGWYSTSSQDPLSQITAGAAKGKVFDTLTSFLKEKQWTYPGFTESLNQVKQTETLATKLKERKEMAQRLNASSAEVRNELQREIAEIEGQQQDLTPAVDSIEKSLPSEIVCHGTIAGIRWKTKSALFSSGIPDGEIKISLGNTQVEALAALFESQLSNSLVRLLEAFQYDLLSEQQKPGGYELVEQKIYERAFRPQTHGIRWDVIEQDQSRLRRGDEEKTAPIPGDIWTQLENLNIRQRHINRLRRELDSAKSQLYATWYTKAINAEQSRVDESVVDQQLAEWQGAVDRLTREIAALEVQPEGRPKGSEWDQLQASLKAFLPGFELHRQDESRFWRPNDPVVLLAGRPFQRSSRHGEDGRYRSDGGLLCRLSGQEITGIKIAVPRSKDVEFGPKDLDRWSSPFVPDKPPIPDECVDLFREFLFLTLDEKRAHSAIHVAYEKIEQGLAGKHPADVKDLSEKLVRWCDETFRHSSSPDLGAQPSVDSKIFAPTSDQSVIPSPVGKKKWKENPWLPLFLRWEVSWQPTYSETKSALENWDLSKNGTEFEWRGDAAVNSEAAYSGTVLLTSSASLNFSERLREYNLTHNNPALLRLQTAVRSMNILCQSLGGFTENLLTRRARLELRPTEPDNGVSPIFDKVKDIDWLSPLNEQQLFPVRAGHLKVESLRVIDAFGQIFELSEESLTSVYRPSHLSGPGGSAQLEPRLSQPARLTMNWLPAWQSKGNAGNGGRPETEELNPVCGWILPNFLDKALMIYDTKGHGLGALQAVKTLSWEQGVGNKRPAIEGFHWIGFPGTKSFYFRKSSIKDNDPLGPKANPHLREFVKSLLSLTRKSGDAFSGLLDRINEALSVAGGAGSAHDPNMSLLVGKPLALVRASIALELDGSPARSQNWDDLQKNMEDRTRGVEKLKFPIRLGDRREWKGLWLGEDGLVGFFQNQDYTHFFPAYGLTGRADDSYSQPSVVPEISAAMPLDLTLLMDPSRGVSATTGVLPRHVFEFPYGDITKTLETRHIIFYTGPVLSPKSPSKPEISMPRPSDLYGQWSWTHHPEVDLWSEKGITDTQKEQGHFVEDSLEITEGWLKLVTAPLAVRVLTVKGKNAVHKGEKPNGKTTEPEEFEAGHDDSIVLSWGVTGADEIELLQGNSSIFKSHRHPLPEQYLVRVNRDTSFTLVATARADSLSEAAGKREKKTINVKLKLSS